MKNPIDARYWQNRYQLEDTPWDIGGISPAMQEVLESLASPDLRILIPGAGRGYEAGWLHRHGFRNITVCDWAKAALDGLRANCLDFPDENLILADFFNLRGEYDVILEQTFLSALHPDQWPSYMNHCADLLLPGGRLTGLLFASRFPKPGPPFGADESAYRSLLSPRFTIDAMGITPNSIRPRQGNELFFNATRI